LVGARSEFLRVLEHTVTMAATAMTSAPVMAKASVASKAGARQQARTPFAKAQNEWAKKTVSNGIKTRQMMVWQPFNNKMFETFSFLPPLSDGEIARQVEYVTANGWTPCLEFAGPDEAYVSSASSVRFGAVSSNYYDNRYWTMWKLPMFGCSDPGQVLAEVQACRRAFPEAYIRLVAFDPVRQVQCMGMLVHRPTNARDWRPADKRQV
jgi:ribulose-bisphosphate carboxylase small chain